MSLSGVLNNAITGLNAAQTALRNTTSNITNVNTPGYARRVAEFSSITAGGQAVGVEVAEIRRIVDQFLVGALRQAGADTSRYAAMTGLHDRLQSTLGDPTRDTSLAARLDKVFQSLANLPIDPASQIRRSAIVTELNSLGGDLGRVLRDIQALRGEADRQIVADLATANAAMTRIHEINQQVLRERLAGRETASLEDARDQALRELGSIIDVTTFQLSNGGVGVSTASGVVLVDDLRRQFVYEGPGSISAETQFGQIMLHRVNSISGSLDPNGFAMDARIQSGSLRGLLDMRDSGLPAVARELGEFAGALGDRLNAVHNAHVSVPPATALVGRNSGLLGTDLHGFTGQATFHAFDANGDVAASFTLDFDALPAGSTLDDVIAAVNAGLGGAASLDFTDGVMSFAGGTAEGVGIEQGTPPSARAGRGFSHFFGMNDLVGANSPFHHQTGLLATSAHGFTGQVTFDVRGPNNEAPLKATIDFGSIGANMTDVLGALNSGTGLGAYFSFGLDAGGALVATPKSGFAGYRLEASVDSSSRGATGLTFSTMFGVGALHQVHRAQDFGVRQDLAADPGRISLARVDSSGSPALNPGDGRGALALQAVADAVLSFRPAGGLPALGLRAGDYLGRILAGAGQAASVSESLLADRRALENEIERRAQGVSGVNLDEELSNMIIFQNAYNASARVVAVSRELFDVLLRL